MTNHNPLDDWFFEGEGGWVYQTHTPCNRTVKCDPPWDLSAALRLVKNHVCPVDTQTQVR